VAKSLALKALRLAKNIQSIAPKRYLPPTAGIRPKSFPVLPPDLLDSTRVYIQMVGFQVNGCYENGWFDGCAVMMRRLLETLIIECFEAHMLGDAIKDPRSGDFMYLSDLVPLTLAEKSWNLGRNTKRAMPRLKNIGDYSAHSRRFIARRDDIDRLRDDFRITCEELIHIAEGHANGANTNPKK